MATRLVTATSNTASMRRIFGARERRSKAESERGEPPSQLGSTERYMNSAAPALTKAVAGAT